MTAQWWRAEADAAINTASFLASNHIYEHAGRYERRADYGPLELLAHEIQHAVVEAGCRFLREYEPDEEPA